MTRWPNSVVRAVLAYPQGQMPDAGDIRDIDPRQARRDFAALALRVAELEEEHRILSEAIGKPCQDAAEARYFAMSQIRHECQRQVHTASARAAMQRQTAAVHERNEDRSIARVDRLKKLTANLLLRGVVIGSRMPAEDWSLADPDGSLWGGLSERQIERDKTDIRRNSR